MNRIHAAALEIQEFCYLRVGWRELCWRAQARESPFRRRRD